MSGMKGATVVVVVVLCWLSALNGSSLGAWQENVRPKMYVQLGKFHDQLFLVSYILRQK